MKGKTTPLTTIFEKGAVNHRPSAAYVVQGFTVAVERLFWQGSSGRLSRRSTLGSGLGRCAFPAVRRACYIKSHAHATVAAGKYRRGLTLEADKATLVHPYPRGKD